MEKEIKNKIIVITGGADGIGFSIARNYLKADAKLVILLDINEERGHQASEELAKEFGGNKVVYFKCDVVSDLEEIYQKICDNFGKVDVLVNSAGIRNEEIPEQSISVNFTATIKWSLKFMELMRKDVNGNGGTIINISSIFGYRIVHVAPVYNAVKFGIVGFTKSLGHDKHYSTKKVRIIALCPGFTLTNMTKDIEDGGPEFTELKNGHKWQTADKVGEKAVEVFKVADSGSIWEIEGGDLKEIK